jgi:hypothetical protein
MIHIGAHNLHPPSLIAGQTGPFFCFVLLPIIFSGRLTVDPMPR